MLLNIQRGHLYLMNTFGYSPRAAWSLETTGHPVTSPRLYSECGIESVFLLYLDPEERKDRLSYSEMEFVWRPMFSHLGRKTEVLAHIFYDFFKSPLDLVVLDSATNDDFDPT